MPIVKNDVQILTYALNYVVQCNGKPLDNFKELMKSQIESLTEYEIKMLIKECKSLRESFVRYYGGRNPMLAKDYADRINAFKKIFHGELRRREEKKAELTTEEKTAYLFALRYAMPRQTYALSIVIDCIVPHIKDFTKHELQQMIDESNEVLHRNEISSNKFLSDCDVKQHMRLQNICTDEMARRGELP